MALGSASCRQQTGDRTQGATHRVAGPMVGAVTPTSAKVWFRVEPSAAVQVEYDIDGQFDGDSVATQPLVTEIGHDYTGTIDVTGLAPDTSYFYRIVIDGEPGKARARLKTFPVKADSVKIALLTDLMGKKDVPAFVPLADEDPDFVIVLGDWGHRNPSTVEKMRRMHLAFRTASSPSGVQFAELVLSRFPVAHVWDDHDFGENNADKTFAGRSSAIRAFDEYWPTYPRPNPDAGLWHRFTYGDLVEVFMLDLRSQRDPNCCALPSDPAKSMLDGDASDGAPKGQKTWLVDRLLASRAPWKILVSSVPWNPTNLKDDAWWSFSAERQELLDFIDRHRIGGVLVVSGDIHAGGAIDDGSNAGLPELNVPAANVEGEDTSCRARVPFPDGPRRLVSCGRWSEGFVPGGVGYGLVSLDRTRAALAAKNASGDLVFQLEIDR
jgi:alkaline phosphatase D